MATIDTSQGSSPLKPIDPNIKEDKPHKAVKIKPVTQHHTPESKIHEIAVKSVSASRATPLKDVPRVPYISLEVLLEKLQPGDIILSYYPESKSLIDVGIRTGNILNKLVTPTSTDESHNFVHAAFYLGDGKISESISNGLRISELDGERFKLKPGMTHSFLIIRPENQDMAKEACIIAKELSAKGQDETSNYVYSITKAIFSGFSSGGLEHKGLVRYLKGAAYAHNKIQPMSKSGIREFFCSYFVGWAFQAGESKDVLEKVNLSLPKGKKITFPDLSQVPQHEHSKVLSEWANKEAKKHAKVLKKNISLDFDPKLTSPQRLYGFFLEHPEQFTQEMMIIAPQQETEMKDFGKKSDVPL